MGGWCIVVMAFNRRGDAWRVGLVVCGDAVALQKGLNGGFASSETFV